MKRSALLLGFLMLLLPSAASADLTIRPFFIDVSLTQRESATEIIKISSTYEHRKATVFPTVNEITIGTEGEIKEFIAPVMTDRSNSVTSWIEISRGQVAVAPGTEVEVPLKVTAHPLAIPGEYHVFIGMVEARNRTIADQIVAKGEAKGIILKVTIEDQRVDSMKVARLSVDRFITNADSQTIDITVENPGEISSAPKGELVFYNTRGAEVGAVAVNEDGVAIPAGGERTFAVQVPFEKDIGRFKANLNLTYGGTQTASLYDTTSFFMVPIWYLLLFGFGLLALVTLLTMFVHRAVSANVPDEHGEEVSMYFRDGHDANPQDHDIDLSEKS